MRALCHPVPTFPPAGCGCWRNSVVGPLLGLLPQQGAHHLVHRRGALQSPAQPEQGGGALAVAVTPAGCPPPGWAGVSSGGGGRVSRGARRA